MHQLKGSWGKICRRFEVRKESVKWLDIIPVHHCHSNSMVVQVLGRRELTEEEKIALWGELLYLEQGEEPMNGTEKDQSKKNTKDRKYLRQDNTLCKSMN